MKTSFLILIYLFYFSIADGDDRLVFLYTHFRHGARAPMDIKNDYTDLLGEKWTNPGELTGMGQRMHYLLGLRNRMRYIEKEKFLSEKFDAHEILIYSSNLNRTMLSASSQLQGLYPQSSKKGEILTEAQEKAAVPQVDVDCDEINNEIKALNKSALPYYMTLAPVRMVNDNDKKMNVYDLKDCTEERDQVKKENRETIPEALNFTQEFNEKYGKTLKEYMKTQKDEYNLLDINEFCDAFLSSYTDQRELSNFKKTGIDFEEMNDYCYEYFRICYLYQYHGDKEKKLAHIDSSKLMTELMFHMKRRLDADMTVEDEDENYKDYSYPKWLMISGHDSTTSADEIFMLNALGLNISELYIFPKYAAQLALEVRTNKEPTKAKSYADYYVIGYFNDEQLFNTTADNFIEKIEGEIWSQDEIDEFCGFEGANSNTDTKNNSEGSNSDKNNTSDNISNNTSNSTDNEDGTVKKKDKAKKAYKVLMIVFICLAAILLAITMCLACKLCRRSPAAPIDPNFTINNTNQNMKI